MNDVAVRDKTLAATRANASSSARRFSSSPVAWRRWFNRSAASTIASRCSAMALAFDRASSMGLAEAVNEPEPTTTSAPHKIAVATTFRVREGNRGMVGAWSRKSLDSCLSVVPPDPTDRMVAATALSAVSPGFQARLGKSAGCSGEGNDRAVSHPYRAESVLEHLDRVGVGPGGHGKRACRGIG
jgi:hypothetical protein